MNSCDEAPTSGSSSHEERHFGHHRGFGAGRRLRRQRTHASGRGRHGVSGYTIGPDYQGKNKNKLRNEAATKGGNFVRLEQNDSDGNASGTAYRCP